MDATTDEPNSPFARRPARHGRSVAVLLGAPLAAHALWAMGDGSAPSTRAPLDWSHPAVLVALAAGLAALCMMAFLSLSELALVSVSRPRVRKRAEEHDRRAELLMVLFADEDASYLSGIMIAINVLVIVVANTTALVAIRTGHGSHGPWIAAVQILVTLLVGEIIPKTLATHHAERYALLVAPPVHRLVHSLVFRWGLGVVNAVSRPVRRLFGVTELRGRVLVSSEEIEALADVAEEEGVLEAEEAHMIDGIVAFRDLTTREIMVSRVDVVALPADCSLPDAVDTITREGKSRIPVYEGDLDHVAGVLYANDLLAAYHEGRASGTVRELVRPAFAVPDTMRIDALFRELQRRRVHMALVIDEHGGVDGIVTIEDVLEEIFGGISDEHDTEEDPVVSMGPGEWRFLANTSRHEVETVLGIALPDGDFDTIAGFMMTELHALPHTGERVDHEGYAFVVGEVEGPRVRTVLVRRLSAVEAVRDALDDADRAGPE